VTAHWEMLLWPALGLLLYATFTQIPLTRLSTALRDGRFLTALLLGNFVLIPLIVGLVTALIPMEPALRLGVLLVLLVPCTDWFITFTHLGGWDAQRAIGATPIILLAQLLLLPVYLWLFMGEQAIELATSRPLLLAFAGLIVVPLLLAWITERATERNAGGASIITSAAAGDRGISDCRLTGRPDHRSWHDTVAGGAYVRCIPVDGRRAGQTARTRFSVECTKRPNACIQPGHAQLVCHTATGTGPARHLGCRCGCHRSAITGGAVRHDVLPRLHAPLPESDRSVDLGPAPQQRRQGTLSAN
jgi:hypothetical protein